MFFPGLPEKIKQHTQREVEMYLLVLFIAELKVALVTQKEQVRGEDLVFLPPTAGPGIHAFYQLPAVSSFSQLLL